MGDGVAIQTQPISEKDFGAVDQSKLAFSSPCQSNLQTFLFDFHNKYCHCPFTIIINKDV